MFNTQVSRAYDIGSKVELVQDYDSLEAGWHGTIREAGVTPDNLYHEYAIEDNEGGLQTIPGNILRPWIEGSRNNLDKILKNIIPFIDDNDERKDFNKMYSMLELKAPEGYPLAIIMYQYGKTQGKSQERLERKRKKLMNNYPDIRESTKRASNKAIEIAYQIENLAQEKRDFLIDFMTKEKEPQTTLTR